MSESPSETASASEPQSRDTDSAQSAESGEKEKEEKEEDAETAEEKEVKTEEKKTPKKRGPPKEKEPPREGERKSERAPKQTTPFKPAESMREPEALVVPEGSGTPIGEISNCAKALKTYKTTEKFLGKLHRLMFGVPAKKAKVKINIARFKGFPEADKAKIEKKAQTAKLEMKDLKPMCHVLDLDRSGTRDELISRVVEFLMKPRSSGKEYKSADKSEGSRKKGEKRKASSKKKGEKAAKPLSGYMMFVKANREKVRAKNPEASFGEVGKLLGAKWNKLDDDDKAEWTEKGKKEFKASGGKKSPKKKSKKDDASSSSDDDDSGESSESEEEGLSDGIKKKIQEILKGDVESLSVKKIKELLKADFADEVENKGDEIKAFVRECLK